MSAPLPVDTIVDEAEARSLESARQFRRWLEEMAPLGLARVTDAEFLVFCDQQQAAFSPEPWITPEGEAVTASPWLLMLSVAEGGDAWLKRYLRLRGGDGDLPHA